MYVDVTQGVNETVRLAHKDDAWEKLTTEIYDGKFSFKQKVSGNYFGGDVVKDKNPRWAPHNKEWEKYTLEDRGNGNVAIKSYLNTYLTQEGEQLVWREQSQNGSELFQFVRHNAPVATGQGLYSNFSGQQSNYSLPAVGNTIVFGQGTRYVGGVKGKD